MTDVRYWLWLSSVMGAGNEISGRLVTFFGDPENVYNAGRDALDAFCATEELASVKLEPLFEKDMRRVDAALEYCEKNGAFVITPDDARYSERLRQIKNPPLALFCKGELPTIDDSICVSVVGTRKFTEYGASMAFKIAAEAAKSGAVIISGMAKGIDSVAHQAALSVGGRTVAVFGCGIDRAYPAENKALMEKIIENGAVMTEYFPYTAPDGANFPVRNRIIAGLSQALLVAEAPLRSGALITARLAQEEGRRIFAVPGREGETTSTGTNMLIRQGACAAVSGSDILLKFAYIYPNRVSGTEDASGAAKRAFSKAAAVAGSGEKTDIISCVKSVGNEKASAHKAESGISSAPEASVPTDVMGAAAETVPSTDVQAGVTDKKTHKIFQSFAAKVLIDRKKQNRDPSKLPAECRMRRVAPDGVYTESQKKALGVLKKYGREIPEELPANISLERLAEAVEAGEAAKARMESLMPFPPAEQSAPAIADETVLTQTQKNILEKLTQTPQTADELTAADCSVSDVMSALTMLEIYGLAEPLPGGIYRAK